MRLHAWIGSTGGRRRRWLGLRLGFRRYRRTERSLPGRPSVVGYRLRQRAALHTQGVLDQARVEHRLRADLLPRAELGAWLPARHKPGLRTVGRHLPALRSLPEWVGAEVDNHLESELLFWCAAGGGAARGETLLDLRRLRLRPLPRLVRLPLRRGLAEDVGGHLLPDLLQRAGAQPCQRGHVGRAALVGEAGLRGLLLRVPRAWTQRFDVGAVRRLLERAPGLPRVPVGRGGLHTRACSRAWWRRAERVHTGGFYGLALSAERGGVVVRREDFLQQRLDVAAARYRCLLAWRSHARKLLQPRVRERAAENAHVVGLALLPVLKGFLTLLHQDLVALLHLFKLDRVGLLHLLQFLLGSVGHALDLDLGLVVQRVHLHLLVVPALVQRLLRRVVPRILPLPIRSGLRVQHVLLVAVVLSPLVQLKLGLVDGQLRLGVWVDRHRTRRLWRRR